MDKKNSVKVAMVGYHNTLPFLYGLENDDLFKLILDVPSRCMDYFSNGEANIALVPVATLLRRDDYKIITDYCIGCIGKVQTVCLFTNGEISNVKKIYLDIDSRTSQKLVKILCERHWHIEPSYVELDVKNLQSEDLKQNEAVLMIGDKVFGREEAYKYCYDLGEEWQRMTGLPFVFAVWISKNDVDDSVIRKLNLSLSIGVDNINLVLEKYSDLAEKVELAEYFHKYINFNFDDEKKMALNQFLNYASSLKEIEDIKV